MNVAQLQLALGRLSSPAAAEKPDLAGYEAQGESPAGGGESGAHRQASAGMQGLGRQGRAGRSAWEGLAPAGPGNTAGLIEVGTDLKPGKGPRAWGAPVPGVSALEPCSALLSPQGGGEGTMSYAGAGGHTRWPCLPRAGQGQGDWRGDS